MAQLRSPGHTHTHTHKAQPKPVSSLPLSIPGQSKKSFFLFCFFLKHTENVTTVIVDACQ